MDTPDVNPKDAEKIYGALTMLFYEKADSYEQQEIEDPNPITAEELRDRCFRWGDYVEECLEYLVDVYDGVEKMEDGYAIRKLEQEKHLKRSEE